MPAIQLTENTFDQIISEPGIVVIDFWAARCGPCRMFTPIIDRVVRQYPDITFATVNTESEPGLSGSLGVRSVPTLMIFRDGLRLYEEPGALPAGALGQLIASALSQVSPPKEATSNPGRRALPDLRPGAQAGDMNLQRRSS